MNNENILINQDKDSKYPDSYLDLFTLMTKKLNLMKRTWYLTGLKHPESGETYSCKFVNFRREYVNQVVECLSKLDFETLAKIPHEKEGCAFQLECRYLKSGKIFGLQLDEYKVDGDLYGVSPSMILFGEEAEKAYKALKAGKKL